ncbi:MULTISPECIES: helix-turn-helix transcriptional regulator [unclassified Sphingomonas]|uniref:helix-turn-helix transcriptional regulator n=1 Tax=unclassified Sphingomonas TaxID=196159 RepID=UPI0006F1FB3C|nr:MULTISPECIES: AraC family transcriptional regulator [unclassified Sphingomonas]KQX19123.1 hypothetical protein ASD17_11180 [Sphingomonas sp. Root1294]KQY65324.1 hypothetical protein ASD39_14375 [Sphingomonas sp. Root50]KRB95381.1 hypothetical protein ASE22_05680 [Sphingomonas sp. Root720]
MAAPLMRSMIEPRLAGTQIWSVSPTSTDVTGKARHRHPEGQLVILSQGLLAIELDDMSWLMPCGRIAWIPPDRSHAAKPIGDASGVNVHLGAELGARLPASPTMFQPTDVMEVLLRRMVHWRSDHSLSLRDRRLVDVLVDELEMAEADELRLPMPRDGRLFAAAALAVAEPASKQRLSDWAGRLGTSERSLSRRFRADTGMSVAQWQIASRMMQAAKMLREGVSVTDVTYDLGYDGLSSFIAAFKRSYRMTPAEYRRQAKLLRGGKKIAARDDRP